MISYIKAKLTGRSPKWGKVRKTFLNAFPQCLACGSKKRVIAHHIKPFHEFPELELDFNNLISLCKVHHWDVGHGALNWKAWNEKVIEDAAYFRLMRDRTRLTLKA